MLLLKNAKLYGKTAVDILIAGNQVEAIGNLHTETFRADDSADSTRPDFLEVRELDGATVIPALIDQHVHVTGGGGEGGMTTRCPELQVSDIIEAGVGTLVGLLGTDALTRSVENLLAKTIALKEYGFYAHCLTGAYEIPSPTITGSVMKDIAFLSECIGLKVAISDHRCSHPTYEDLVKLAGEVRLGGLIGKKAGVMHLHVGSGKQGISQIFEIIERENIPSALFRPTHMNNRHDEAMKLAKLGSYPDFTTGTDHRKTAQTVIRAMEEAPEGHITMSSDSNGSMPKWNEKREMVGIGIGKMSTLYGTVKSMVEDFGMDLEKALAPCTVNVAKSLGMYPYVGTLEAGSRADILVLDDNLDIRDFILAGRDVMKNKERLLKINFVD
ncbi:MAG: beta-aspartyl-peptidase [Bacillota bacterium]|nr:beta-aspartyl-peptidase [Bacillota bacterium]